MAFKPVKFTRKVQLTGGSTLTVSLPKEWVKVINLKQGDEVHIYMLPDNTLKIVPAKAIKPPVLETSIRISRTMSPGACVREFTSRYLLGFNIIRVSFDERTDVHRKVLRETIMKRMIGVEVVEESADEFVVQVLTDYRSLPVRQALQRMARTANNMLEDILPNIVEQDRKILLDVIERDNVVDKFYLFLSRQINAIMLGLALPSEIGVEDLLTATLLRACAKSIERVADHAASIARILTLTPGGSIKASGKDIVEEVLKMGDISHNLFNEALNALFKSNPILAHHVIDKVAIVRGIEYKILRKIVELKQYPQAIVALRTVIESLRRVADYSADISEVVIDLNSEKPS